MQWIEVGFPEFLRGDGRFERKRRREEKRSKEGSVSVGNGQETGEVLWVYRFSLVVLPSFLAPGVEGGGLMP